jgi:7-cyano-7-deazaguanine synthase
MGKTPRYLLNMKKAIVLLSGGMDSAVTLYVARGEYDCRALVFNYGQKAGKEIDMASKLSAASGVPLEVLDLPMPWKGSALTDMDHSVPRFNGPAGKIPSTYVPARNMIFLSFGVSCAEATGAEAVFIGAHQLDFSNYPDCRGSFFDSFRETVKRGTKEGVEGRAVRIETPLIDMTKREILEKGLELGVPFEFTWSCYNGGEYPCGECESCLFRSGAFESAGASDPLIKE